MWAPFWAHNMQDFPTVDVQELTPCGGGLTEDMSITMDHHVSRGGYIQNN